MDKAEDKYVILVDENDNPIGKMEKIEAHEKGLLHRAFSVFVFNDKDELLLQQRALTKYHTPGLWTNTCCSHQKEGESHVEAGKRRLQEEMGFSVPLREVMSFIYKAPFANGLTEHEFDHILIGYYNHDPKPNPDEVADFKWRTLNQIKANMAKYPEQYTAWFKIIFEKYLSAINTKKVI
ncbi:isopentenyl-diphosphate Delta-isomerase [Mesohalobacter halotolerans]|uniref:Isopentenyl-diphosphate delta-isomerase n=1 Tax=Mesohalobacter halotolerans TaxID=1883405 RepID=A0A4U5TRE9_9FLAO|nr:isopentenyl-diphosphate Delta-isomerase [Mesohalobacter halotolerans]MBS3739550.1 isopentenyl-diphosphate Delta-isomerase [Psychroflexus sp.]TKS56653.1 isopentenyl-diphosphate Delta-isomerase [Mesohalobacter halotolerans]